MKMMNNKLRTFFLIVSLMLIMSCSESVSIQLEPEVNLFHSDGMEEPTTLTQKDEAYRILNKWLLENKDDWSLTSGRYPGGIYIKSGDYGIQIKEKQVVIYSAENSEPRALYIKDINKGELVVR